MNFKIYARAIILNQAQDKVLLIKKNSNQKIAPGEWLLPGGTLDFSETPEQTLIREVKEETNLNLSTSSFLDTKTMIINNTHWLGLYYVSKVKDVKALNNNEPNKHEKIEFISLNELPEMVDSHIINNYIQNIS